MKKPYRVRLTVICVALLATLFCHNVVLGGGVVDYGTLPDTPERVNYVAWMSVAGVPPSQVLTEDGYSSADGVDQGYQIGMWILNPSNFMNPAPVNASQMYMVFGGLEDTAGTIWTYDFVLDLTEPVIDHGEVGTAAVGNCPAILPGSWNGTQKTINWSAPPGTYLIYRSVNASGADNGASNGRYDYVDTVTTTGNTGSYVDDIAVESWHIVIPANSGGNITGCHSEESNPTAVTLVRFEALPESSQVHVEWETATELDNLGFNLYRGESATGPWVKLNAALIPAQQPGLVTGAVYEWLDEAVPPDTTVFYRLEDVDIRGVSTFHGPVSVTPAGPAAIGLRSFAASSPMAPVVVLGCIILGAALPAGWSLQRRRRTS